jgi:hypothetical protein
MQLIEHVPNEYIYVNLSSLFRVFPIVSIIIIATFFPGAFPVSQLLFGLGPLETLTDVQNLDPLLDVLWLTPDGKPSQLTFDVFIVNTECRRSKDPRLCNPFSDSIVHELGELRWWNAGWDVEVVSDLLDSEKSRWGEWVYWWQIWC